MDHHPRCIVTGFHRWSTCIEVTHNEPPPAHQANTAGNTIQYGARGPKGTHAYMHTCTHTQNYTFTWIWVQHRPAPDIQIDPGACTQHTHSQNVHRDIYSKTYLLPQTHRPRYTTQGDLQHVKSYARLKKKDEQLDADPSIQIQDDR